MKCTSNATTVFVILVDALYKAFPSTYLTRTMQQLQMMPIRFATSRASKSCVKWSIIWLACCYIFFAWTTRWFNIGSDAMPLPTTLLSAPLCIHLHTPDTKTHCAAKTEVRSMQGCITSIVGCIKAYLEIYVGSDESTSGKRARLRSTSYSLAHDKPFLPARAPTRLQLSDLPAGMINLQ